MKNILLNIAYIIGSIIVSFIIAFICIAILSPIAAFCVYHGEKMSFTYQPNDELYAMIFGGIVIASCFIGVKVFNKLTD